MLCPPHRRTKSRAWEARAVLADPNGLWWGARVTEATRLPGRSVEPQAANLRVLGLIPPHSQPRAYDTLLSDTMATDPSVQPMQLSSTQ